jgi:TolB protein
VVGRVATESGNRLRADFRLFDVVAGQHFMGTQYLLTPDRWDLIGHLIAGEIYRRLTGQSRTFE